MKNPQMLMKRVIMILSASLEFEKGSNPEIKERPTDNIEVPKVCKIHVFFFSKPYSI